MRELATDVTLLPATAPNYYVDPADGPVRACARCEVLWQGSALTCWVCGARTMRLGSVRAWRKSMFRADK